MKIPLLDTNLLLALAWPNHQHHAMAHEWFSRHAKRGWATCAFTQLGFVRLSSNPVYSADAVSPQDAAALLQQWTKHKAHHFWNSPAADAPAIYSRALGHQQVNDAWLVEVARKNRGRLVTLDTRLVAHAAETDLVEAIIS
ncbi:MAG TPA: TA system VapC family ribonuclease toxin [Verrucomicrobiae bacterium]|nr:TA system VapC family ribonuclease toxin [Verrucomicrobiae bacterium]